MFTRTIAISGNVQFVDVFKVLFKMNMAKNRFYNK